MNEHMRVERVGKEKAEQRAAKEEDDREILNCTELVEEKEYE